MFSYFLKVSGEKQTAYESTQKHSDRKMQGIVTGIDHCESKWLFEKCASSPN